MSKIDYQVLREKAEKATKGSYIVGHTSVNQHGNLTGVFVCQKWKGEPGGVIAECHVNCLVETDAQAYANAEFIAAANPATVLALLDELEAKDKVWSAQDNHINQQADRIESLEKKNGELGRALEAAEKRIAELEAEPVSQTYNLPELIEGMEVSIDVSTCDADLGNRYFGTVTEALELDTAKNGYILLVQDAEPNFDINGNSPVTTDGWISCSERMPEKNQNVLISVNFDSSLVEPLICSARYTGSTFRRGEATIKPGNGIEQATHWMTLPEPPQEVK
ncbi:ead/Ea22-like family protein [Escherichia coli]|nr:ead/Ea22-like family protein [Escherichia coli]